MNKNALFSIHYPLVPHLLQHTICTSPCPSVADRQKLRVSATLNGPFNSQQPKTRMGRIEAGGEVGKSARCYQSITDPQGQKQLLSLTVWPSCGHCLVTSLCSTYGCPGKEALMQVSKGASHFDCSVC